MSVVSLAATGDGSGVASSSMDGCIRIYDLAEGSLKKTIQAGLAETWTIAYHPTEPLLCSGTHAGNVNLWDVNSGDKKLVLPGSAKFTMSVAFAPGGSVIASGHHDGVVNLFDLATGKVVHKLAGHAKPVRGLAFSNDGSVLLTACEDHRINVYEVKSGEQVASLSGHQSWVLGVAFNPRNDTAFVSSSADKRVKVWDLKTRECQHTFSAGDQVWGVSCSPDGRQVAAACEDGAVIIYDAHDK